MRAVKFLVFFFALTVFCSSANAQCDPRTGKGCISNQSAERVYISETATVREVHIDRAGYNDAYANSPRVSHNSGAQVYVEPNRNYSYSRQERISRGAGYNQGYIEPVAYNQDQPIQTQKTKTAQYNPKDGSMFPGGRCDGGKCNKDGSMFGGGCNIPKGKCMKACKQKCSSPFGRSCENSCKPCFQCNTKEATYQTVYLQDYIVKQQDEVYDAIHKCKDLAPIELKFVDFRIKKNRDFTGFSEKLGNYRFRIFGCRRFDKQAMLNQGRIIQKDLKFINIFDDMASDCLNIVKTPKDLCDPNNNSPLPEYVLTAEITDYFMNVCDKYNWDKAKKEDLRLGSSEMTITWRLTNVTGTEVLWKGETVGYAELDEGEYNGEIVLLERAFADAVNSLRQLPGFEDQLSKRVSPEQLVRQRLELVELEKISNPIKCQFQEEIKVAEAKKECGIKTVCTEVDTCSNEVISQQVDIKKEIKEIITIEKDRTTIDENSGSNSTGDSVLEDGGSSSTASVTSKKETTSIDENSGLSSSGSGSMDETTSTTIRETTSIDENSGLSSSGSGSMDETTSTTIRETISIDENSGLSSSGSGSMDETTSTTIREITSIDENSGMSSSGSGSMDETITFEVVENIIDEKGSVMSSGINESSGSLSAGAFEDEVWIDLPMENAPATVEITKEVDNSIIEFTGEVGDIDGSDSLCIIDRPPYETLSAENVYKIRSSIVNITNAQGKKGSGLIISNQFVLTSANLVSKNNNTYDIETINGTKLKATAFRINPNKNIALLLLDRKTRYNPLPLNLNLPETGRGGYLTLGMLNKDNIKGKLEDGAKVIGYRYTDNVGSEIIVNTNVQRSTLGGALIDSQGTISGISHSERGTDDGKDLFLPITTALKSVGLSICGKEFPEQRQVQWYERSTTKPIAKVIDNYKAPKAPEKLKDDEVK